MPRDEWSANDANRTPETRGTSKPVAAADCLSAPMTPPPSGASPARPSGEIDDREMLTWLILHFASFGSSGQLVEVRGGEPVWRDTVFVRVPCQHLYEWHCFDGADARDAIRNAMDAEPCAFDEKHGCTQSRTIREHGAETPMMLLEERNAQLLRALYHGSPTACALADVVQRRINEADFMTDESRAAFVLRDVLDSIVVEASNA